MNRHHIFLFLFLCIASFGLQGQQSATLQGGVFDDQNTPIESVQIFIAGSNTSILSNENGGFSLKVPASQNVDIHFRHVFFLDTVIHIFIPENEIEEIRITLHTKGKQLGTISVTAKHHDGNIQIDPKLDHRMTSIGGGVESILKTMPGIYSANELSSQYNVRGGNYDENLVYVNDIEIHRPFLIRSAQQEGLSFVNLDLTNSVKFSAGGFEAKYGDKMSSVMDVEYKTPTGYGSSFSASLLGVTAHTEGNVKDTFTYLVGVRYKSNAYILKSMETKGDYQPRFFDAQMLFTWKPLKKLEIDLLGNFSNNTYLLTPTDRNTSFGTFENMKKLSIYFEGQEVDKYENYLGGLTFKYKIDPKNKLRWIFSTYYAKESETYDILGEYWLHELENDMGNKNGDIAKEGALVGVGGYLDHARNHIKALVSAMDMRGEHALKKNSISWGMKFQNEIIDDRIKEWHLFDSAGYTLPNLPDSPGNITPFGDPSRELVFKDGDYLVSNNSLNTWRLSGFIQNTWRIDGDSATRFILTAGLRYNFWSYNKEFLVSPRISFIYKPYRAKNWTFYFRTGMYYQPPFYREMRDYDGNLNKDIKAQRSAQAVMASEYSFKIWNRPFKFSAEVYYKYMDRLISYTMDNVKIMYTGENDAVGYATGIDMRLSGEFVNGLESWVSLSIMKTAEDILNDYNSEKQVEPGYIPRLTDQRFSINIFFQDHIPNVYPLRVHLNFVFASGMPYGKPKVERYKSVFEATGKVLRNTWYRRVDIGFSYMILEESRDRMKHNSKFFRAFKSMGVFFEVFNLLGTYNVSSHIWIPDVQNQLYIVPNYLTHRLFNLKLAIEF